MIENFAYGEINERSFSNPYPWGLIHGAGLPQARSIS